MNLLVETTLTVEQVIWLLVAVLWGTFKIRGATAQLPQDIFAKENDWTFGQIVPVLLLVVPMFATIINFASDEINPECLDQDGHGISSVGMSRAYPFATHSSELPDTLTATYTSRARWLWPSLVGLLLSTTYFTYEVFSQNFDFAKGLEAHGSLVEVWVTRFGLLWYMILGLPCTLSNTVAIGLALDAWFESPRKLVTRTKIATYQILVIFLAVAYSVAWLFLVYFGFQSYLFPGLYVSDNFVDKIFLHIFTCMLVAILYYGLYFVVAFSVRVPIRKGTQHGVCE